MKIKLIHSILIINLFLVACGSEMMPSKQTTGAVIGGLGGGIAGSQIGKGRGRDVAMVVGTLLGAALGGSIGSSMDQTDVLRTQQALSYNRTGQQVSWQNPDTQAQYTVTPTNTFRNNSGQDCRSYTTVAVIEGKREELHGTACRQPDGTWKASN
ncbi:17 kDa surface antigen precursor [Thioploca ingrica]|uniref:17 kDa surface antigen n=1 Tax=Thioploca ingrica TaxID=40754 RepID=A0A090AI60_9GAMM|nr:17 kDa surface antigen precursor [Thioploca ingrica]